MKNFWFLSVISLCLVGCSGQEDFSSGVKTHSPIRATSRPYQIKGIWYYPQAHYELDETGVSSCYGGPDGCHGLPTATGEQFDMFELTAAHKTVPLPCVAVITNLENGKRLKVKINDRGPFKNNRILDVSIRAAQILGFYEKGTAMVRVQTLPDESILLAENVKAFERRGLRVSGYAQAQPLPPSLETQAVLGALDRMITARPTQTVNGPNIQSLIESTRTQKTHQQVRSSPKHPHLYIQAGRYASSFEATRHIQSLKTFGNTSVREETASAGLPFKVEIGPLKNVAEADRVLDQLLASGHTQARIVIQ